MARGHMITEETKEKISLANAGKHNSLRTEFKKGQKFSEEFKQKMRGKKLSENHKRKISEGIRKNPPSTIFKKGQKPWNYIDGRSKILTPARYGDDWDKIRYLVYLRDKFICQDCGAFGIKLHVHHKIPFLISKDNSLNNLITLCVSCHRKEDAKIMKELKKQEIII
jgi:hypothetical protein